MSYIHNFKKIRGKNIYCVGLQKSYSKKNNFADNIVSYFDVGTYPKIFGQADRELSSIGLCIEPMTIEQNQQARSGIKIKPQQEEFQENAVCLLFDDVESIEEMIHYLNKCKHRLKEKIKVRKQEEYRRKYCGQVIQMSDILKLKGGEVAL